MNGIVAPSTIFDPSEVSATWELVEGGHTGMIQGQQPIDLQTCLLQEASPCPA